MEQWRKRLIEINPKLPELHKKILLDGPQSLGQAWILSGLKKKYEDLTGG